VTQIAGGASKPGTARNLCHRRENIRHATDEAADRTGVQSSYAAKAKQSCHRNLRVLLFSQIHSEVVFVSD
jgi:hypothetical protein